MTVFPRLRCVGDSAILVEFGETIASEINDRVMALDRALQQAPLPGVVDFAPAHASLLVTYDPLRTGPEPLLGTLSRLALEVRPEAIQPRRIEIPVCYDPPFAPDIANVAGQTGLTPDGVIAAHLASAFRVYMYGFTPGCAYMGGLDGAIRLPRRATPVRDVPAGSVIIAGPQCIVTTFTMPTGWWIIGRSPARIYDPASETPFLFSVGDEVHFRRIGLAEFEAGNG